MRPGFDSRRPERNGARRSEVRGERANCFARVRESKAGACRFATARRGREYLVEFKRSEKLYLVTRDHKLLTWFVPATRVMDLLSLVDLF